jgi:hypothetical protein
MKIFVFKVMESSFSLLEEMEKPTHGWGQVMLGNTITFRPPTDCPGYPEQAGHSILDFALIYPTSTCFSSDFSHILLFPIHL